jgi:hypothetical protein
MSNSKVSGGEMVNLGIANMVATAGCAIGIGAIVLVAAGITRLVKLIASRKKEVVEPVIEE